MLLHWTQNPSSEPNCRFGLGAIKTAVNTSICGHLLFCSVHFFKRDMSAHPQRKNGIFIAYHFNCRMKKNRIDNSTRRSRIMPINRQKSFSVSYSCAAAFSVWIPKSSQAKQNDRNLSLAEERQKHLTQDSWSSDSFICKDIVTSRTNWLKKTKFF